jgi:hypothetical protein
MRICYFSFVLLLMNGLSLFSQQSVSFKATVYGQTRDIISYDLSLLTENPIVSVERTDFVNKIQSTIQGDPNWESLQSTLYIVTSDSPIEDSVVVSNNDKVRCIGQIKNATYTMQHYCVFNKGLTFNYIEIGQDASKVFSRLRIELPNGFQEGLLVLTSAGSVKKLYFRFKASKLVEMGW